jgi:hypothetical protein
MFEIFFMRLGSGSVFSEVRNLNNRKHVQECYDQVRRVLLEYCINCYPNVPVSRVILL